MVPKEGFCFASRPLVGRLGLATTSRFRLMAEHRSGVLALTRAKQLARFRPQLTNVRWCRRRDSNPHGFLRTILSRVRPVQVVGGEGLEPSRTCAHRFLRPARIPVPPSAPHLYGVNIPTCPVVSIRGGLLLGSATSAIIKFLGFSLEQKIVPRGGLGNFCYPRQVAPAHFSPTSAIIKVQLIIVIIKKIVKV
jgi:hypothetical protein